MTDSVEGLVIKCKEFTRLDGTRFLQELHVFRHKAWVEFEIHAFHYDRNGTLTTRRSESVLLDADAEMELKAWML